MNRTWLHQKLSRFRHLENYNEWWKIFANKNRDLCKHRTIWLDLDPWRSCLSLKSLMRFVKFLATNFNFFLTKWLGNNKLSLNPGLNLEIANLRDSVLSEENNWNFRSHLTQFRQNLFETALVLLLLLTMGKMWLKDIFLFPQLDKFSCIPQMCCIHCVYRISPLSQDWSKSNKIEKFSTKNLLNEKLFNLFVRRIIISTTTSPILTPFFLLFFKNLWSDSPHTFHDKCIFPTFPKTIWNR